MRAFHEAERSLAAARWPIAKLLLTAGCSMLLAGPMPAQQPTADATAFARRIAGCYEVLPGPWQADNALSGLAQVASWPTRFRLTSARLPGWEGLQNDSLPLYQVIDYPLASQIRRGYTAWRRITTAGDSVDVSRPLPMAGLRLVLHAGAGERVGRIFAFTDSVQDGRSSEESSPVAIRRIACPRE